MSPRLKILGRLVAPLARVWDVRNRGDRCHFGGQRLPTFRGRRAASKQNRYQQYPRAAFSQPMVRSQAATFRLRIGGRCVGRAQPAVLERLGVSHHLRSGKARHRLWYDHQGQDGGKCEDKLDRDRHAFEKGAASAISSSFFNDAASGTSARSGNSRR